MNFKLIDKQWKNKRGEIEVNLNSRSQVGNKKNRRNKKNINVIDHVKSQQKDSFKNKKKRKIVKGQDLDQIKEKVKKKNTRNIELKDLAVEVDYHNDLYYFAINKNDLITLSKIFFYFCKLI